MDQALIDEKWYYVRTERDFLLSQCDWTQISDVQLTEQEKQDWRTYRQALRDITLQSDPFNLTWPTKPDD
jgi:Phage tail assembly chaperone protein